MASVRKLMTSPGYRAAFILTRLALLCEAFWTAATPAVAIALAALAAGLLELPQQIGALFGGWVHAGLLAAVLFALLWSLRRAVIRFQAPDAAATRRRLESTSDLAHRPLTALTDRLANNGDVQARTLWAAFQRQALADSARLRAGPPRPLLAYLDPWGVRAGIGIALIIAVTAAWEDPGARLHAALKPDFSPAGGGPAAIDVWISAPAYTGRPPQLLTQATADSAVVPAVTVPVGSRLLAAVSGGHGVPEIVLERTGQPDESHGFETMGQHSYRLERQIRSSAGLSVRQSGRELARWQLAVIPDLKPEILFAEAPSATQRDSFLLHYTARDDYGVASAAAVIRRLSGDGAVESDASIDVSMPVPGSGRVEVTGRSFTDLTAHPWAGEPVSVTLRATDEIGQTGESEALETVLPERIFSHPVARAVVEQRKRLAGPVEDRTDIARAILSIAARPHQYGHDLSVFLGLKSASSRLLLNEGGEEDASVTALLWDVALQIEDGKLATALEQLRELERRLQEALAGDASDQEIERLMDQLEAAMQRYLQAMAEQSSEQPMPAGDQTVDGRDLREMLDRMRDMAKSGARDMARQMLSRLQEMMENLRMGRPQMSQRQRAFGEMMNQLGEMARQQQSLMDQSYQQYQEGQNASNADGTEERRQRAGQQRNAATMSELARQQEELRRQLGAFMDRLDDVFGGVPGEFDQAGQSMEQASEALGQSQPGQAVSPQSDAIGSLMDGAQALSEMVRQQAGSDGSPVHGMRRGGSPGRDPFNRRRPGEGYFDSGIVGLPTESDLQKARRIINELQRRSGDRSRPLLELDYIDRLLHRF